MADIIDINSSSVTRITGSDATGTEQTPVASNANGKLHIVQVSNNGGVQGDLTVGTTAVELKVGGSALTNRINVTLLNNSNSTIYWGYTNSVTTTTGTPIEKKQFVTWAIGSTTIFLIAGSAGNNARITESA